NTVRAGQGFGVYLDRVEAGRIEQNEVTNNCSGAIMIREAGNAQVERNQLFQNGHGIVVMQGSRAHPNAIIDNLVADQIGDGAVLIGESATVVANRVLHNRHTGLHVSSIVDDHGQLQTGRLFLDRNVVTGNGRDEDHDAYRAAADAMPAATAADCGWRRGLVTLLASTGEPR